MRTICEGARNAELSHGRRQLLTVGALGVGGLTLADVLALQQAQAAPRDDCSTILLWLTGGPSQFDSFDPKPDAPAEVRGPFKPIPTRLDGAQFTEVFEKTAKQAHRLAVLRSVYHPLDNHVTAAGWMTAGRVHDTVNYPPLGSVVARVKPASPVLPAFVTVPRMHLIAGYDETQHFQTAGDLGPAFNPLIPDGVPGDSGFGVRDLGLPAGVDRSRFERRAHLFQGVNPRNSAEALRSPQPRMRALYEKAFDLIHSSEVHRAFDLASEPDKLRDSYGRNGFGQSTLLARRLVESGVRFVTVNWPSYYAWDHHGSIQNGMKSTGGWLDSALSSLLDGLAQRGMLDRTVVMVAGEFGRTPRLNKDAGRDHWVHVMSVLLAGGRIRGGQVYGSSTPDGYPDEKPLHARDMVATLYAALGISVDAELPTMIGRPITVLPGGEPVRDLLHS